MFWVSLIAAAAFGYLLGSVPFGLLITRAAGLGDVRDIGSGNIGATNVLRTGNKFIAAATLACDILKGALPVWIVTAIGGPIAGLVAGFFAFVGHCYPVWLNFKGGKGVATFIGVLLGYAPIFAVVFCATWLATAFAFRFSSLAALIASAVTPLTVWWLGYGDYLVPVLGMTAMIFWRHRDNIARLRKGEESRIGQKTTEDSDTPNPTS